MAVSYQTVINWWRSEKITLKTTDPNILGIDVNKLSARILEKCQILKEREIQYERWQMDMKEDTM